VIGSLRSSISPREAKSNASSYNVASGRAKHNRRGFVAAVFGPPTICSLTLTIGAARRPTRSTLVSIPMDHEEAVIRAFILPTKRERYLEFLTSPKGRAKFISGLAHFKHLDPRFAYPVPGNQSNPASLKRSLLLRAPVPNVGSFPKVAS
jgi:hypothetical protein